LNVEDFEKVYELLQSGKLSGWWGAPNGGPYLRRFEEEFAAYVGARYAVAVSSGSAAIYVAIRALGHRSHIAVTPYTHIGSVAPIVLAGGVPVFVDVDEYGNMDPIDLAKVACSAVIVPHQLGQPSRMDAIRKYCGFFGPLIEDCSQALGAKYRGRMVGSEGIGCFSIGGDMTKTITTGEGGMVTTDDFDIAERCRRLRNHGDKYADSDYLCFNFRMSELQALVGLLQMGGIQPQVDWQVRNADYLIRNLPDYLQVPEPPENAQPCRYIIGCRFSEEKFGASRELFFAKMAGSKLPLGEPRRNIGPGYMNLVYEYPFYKKWARPCPQAERLKREAVWIDYHRWPRAREEMAQLLEALRCLPTSS
jgi:perosamine synthetase